jgi:hypothetical protein
MNPRPFLHPDETPDFITLNVIDGDVLNGLGKERLTLLASRDHRPHDRISVDAGQALNSPDAVAL